MIHLLNLNTLAKLDGGKAVEAFGSLLREAAKDCKERPHDSTKRKVILEVTIEPVLDPVSQTCDRVKSRFHARAKLPELRTQEYSFGLKATGALVFNEDSPTDINQGTMLPDDE